MIEIVVEQAGAVRRIVLNRPAKRNALSAEMLERLIAAFADPPGSGERLVAIEGTGTAFCAGVDLAERLSSGAPRGPSRIPRLCEVIRSYPLPVVACVNGDAVGGGAELALHCDLVIASNAARFGMPLVQIGTAPPWPLMKRVFDLAGPAVAAELLLLGELVPSQRLASLGVIAASVERADFRAVVDAAIRRLAANAPLALRAIKAGLGRLADGASDVEHAIIDEMVTATFRSADAEEGIRARLEGRPPTFNGT